MASHGSGICVATMSTQKAIVALEGKVTVRHDHILFWLGQGWHLEVRSCCRKHFEIEHIQYINIHISIVMILREYEDHYQMLLTYYHRYP